MIRRKSRAAFTIVELLIAASITVLIVVLLGTMLGSLTTTTSRASQRIDAFRDARAAIQMMERDFSGLLRNQRDASGNAITLPTAYFVCTSGSATAPANIYQDPADGNQQIFALVALKNSDSGDVCSVGYYCRWNDQGYGYSLRRFFRPSGPTYTTLAGAGAYASETTLYTPDPVPTTPSNMKDELLAANVWNLKVTAYDATGAQITTYPYICDPSGGQNQLPAALEISFKAMSSEAARTVIAAQADANAWMNPNYPLIKPHAYEFRTRIKL